MSLLKEPISGFIFGSFLYRKDQVDIARLKDLWTKEYTWDDEFLSPHSPMQKYYSKEMCDTPEDFELLERVLVFSHEPIPRDSLIPAKIWATDLEKKHSIGPKRLINLDIGLISLENMVLATGKPYGHRIYLGEGVYGDLNYIYKDGKFETIPWTYPDYGRVEVLKIFEKTREVLKSKTKSQRIVD